MADSPRPLHELSDSGLLWLINASVFHPRGLALGLALDAEGSAVGWTLDGDGSQAWRFDDESMQRGFARAEETIREHRS